MNATMHTTALGHLVRPMNLGDIAQVMEIERESFPSVWAPTAFKRELQQNRLARYLVAVERRDQEGDTAPSPAAPVGAPGGPLARFLGELRQMWGGQEEPSLPPPEERLELIVGFVGVWLMVDEAHIVTIAVRESHRGRGIGELLLISAIEVARENRQPRVSLECRVSNQVALALYQKYGFQQVDLRPRYYSDNREDAYILTAAGVDTAAYQDLFQRLKREHQERWGDYELYL